MNCVERNNMRFAQVEQYLASDLGLNEWCRQNEISKSVLCRWMHLYNTQLEKQEHKESAWIEIDKAQLEQNIAPANLDQRLPCMCIHIRGIDIDIFHDVKHLDILSVLKAVESL